MAQNDFENKRDSADQKIDLRLWKRLIAYAMRHRRTVVSVMLVLLVVAGIDLAYPQLSRYAIDHFIEGGTTEGLWLYGLVYAALVVVQSLGVFLFVRGAGRLEMDMSYDIRQDAFAKLQQLSFSFYDTTSVGWLMARMVSDIARLSDMIAWSLVDLMWAGVFAVGIVVVLLAMNWKLGLLVLCITPVLAALCVFFQKRILKYQRAVRKTNSRITGAFNEGIMGAMTTKTLVREEASAAEFRELTGAMRTASIRSALLSALFMPLVMALGSISTALALSRGGSLVFAGAMGFGTLVGVVNLHGVDEAHCCAETSYALSPAYRGAGLMPEALGAVLRFGFAQAGFNRICAEVLAGNAASVRVLEKCGFRREGILRRRYRKDGCFADAWLYAVLSSEFSDQSK